MTASAPSWRVVSATRMSESEFWRHSYLGRSLLALPQPLRPSELAIRFDNVGDSAVGLAAAFNRAIESARSETIVLCVHDDVYLHDPFLLQRLQEGLRTADIIGLAGSLGSDLQQPSWALGFEGESFASTGWQHGPELVLSGAVGYCPMQNGGELAPPPIALGVYGPTPHPVDLLDGLFLAFRAGVLQASGVSFDERFAFHLYDLDFCRQARRAGLHLSTAPIVTTHASGGDFGSPDWKAAARLYLEKWNALDRSDALFGRCGGEPIGA